MGLPFTVITGTVFITDSDGEIAEVVDRSNGSKALATHTELAGTDKFGIFNNVQTILRSDGIMALATEARVVVESTFGFDQNPDSWFRIVETGGAGTEWTVYIAGTSNDLTTPDRDDPAYSKTFTVQPAEVGDEIELRDRIIQELNADTVFRNDLKFRAIKATDRAIVHITTDRFSLDGDFYERPFLGDFDVTVGGTPGDGVVYIGHPNLVSRSKPITVSRDFDSPHRLGLFGITGSVQVSAKDLDDLFIENATEDGIIGGSVDMTVNGSGGGGTEFRIDAKLETTVFIEELRFYGSGNGIQYGKFLNLNGSLSNGIYIEIKSDDTLTILPLIKTTDDFKNKFAFGEGAGGFSLDIASGRDDFLAVFSFNNPFILQQKGTYTIDDYIKVVIQDNLSQVGSLEFIAKGFEKEP